MVPLHCLWSIECDVLSFLFYSFTCTVRLLFHSLLERRALVHFRTPLGLGLRLALSCIFNRKPKPNPRGVRKCISAETGVRLILDAQQRRGKILDVGGPGGVGS